MKFQEWMQQDKLIIVDIQPAYNNNCAFLWQQDLATFIQSHRNVLVLFNGTKQGLTTDSKSSIAKYYYNNKIPRNFILGMKWFDKGYAFFRDLMDSGCYMREEIIKVIRHMLRKRIYDWRQFTSEDLAKFKSLNLTRNKLEMHFMGLPEMAYMLTSWRNAHIIGGGLDECLEEVMLLADALKLNLIRVDKYTY